MPGGCVGWRQTEGCYAPSESPARVPGRDRDCDRAPGIYDAGYCECDDKIPRYVSCGEPKIACKAACAAPVPPSALAAAFEPLAASPDAPDPPPPEWWRAHPGWAALAALVALALLRAAWHHLFGRKRASARAALVALERAQARSDAAERAVSAAVAAPEPA